MPAKKMHGDEVDIDAALVRHLLISQFPGWAELPLKPVKSTGTDNALYRLGKAMSVRLPRIHWAVEQIEKDHIWLPRLASHLPLSIPKPLALGRPAEGYPFPWAVYEWLEGETLNPDRLADPRQAALDLANFISHLQKIDPAGGPRATDPGARGAPLRHRDGAVREAIDALRDLGLVDADAALAAWKLALEAPDWADAPVWFHGDLLPGNLLFQGGRLSAVIDFGLGVGDPAVDAIPAWALFSGESREAFRSALKVDDATWARGRGWALSIGLIALPYYRDTNPAFAASAGHIIQEVLAEVGAA